MSVCLLSAVLLQHVLRVGLSGGIPEAPTTESERIVKPTSLSQLWGSLTESSLSNDTINHILGIKFK